MPIQPGDIVIARFWKKWRPLLVLDLNEDCKTCKVAPFTTKKARRYELRNGKILLLRRLGEFDNRNRSKSYLVLGHTHPEYQLNRIHKIIGRLDIGQWVTVLMNYHLILRKKKKKKKRKPNSNCKRR